MRAESKLGFFRPLATGRVLATLAVVELGFLLVRAFLATFAVFFT